MNPPLPIVSFSASSQEKREKRRRVWRPGSARTRTAFVWFRDRSEQWPRAAAKTSASGAFCPPRRLREKNAGLVLAIRQELDASASATCDRAREPRACASPRALACDLGQQELLIHIRHDHSLQPMPPRQRFLPLRMQASHKEHAD